MTVVAELEKRIARAAEDREVRRLMPGLDLRLLIHCGDSRLTVGFREGEVSVADVEALATVEVRASPDSWTKFLSDPPAINHQSFTAFQLANPNFEISGQPIDIARSRAAIERLFECMLAVKPDVAPTTKRHLPQIKGQYATIHVQGRAYDVFYEEAGDGIPVLFLHTAGADGRQYQAQLADVELAKHYRMIAVDLPFHGRSFPDLSWDGAPYLLTKDLYRDWCCAIIDQIVGEPPIVVGGSMGAAMSIVLAAECASKIRGVVAVEPPFRSKGRRNPYQNHTAVHAGLHNSAYVRGLMSPTSPEAYRRRASWIYSQGAPGVYAGDLSFYSDEFDGSIFGPQVDAKRTPIALLSGTYDYSATPDDGAKLAALIPGSLHVVMHGLGHFPMCENPDYFRSFLIDALRFVTR